MSAFKVVVLRWMSAFAVVVLRRKGRDMQLMCNCTLCSAALTFVHANCLLIKGCADQVRICRGPIALPSYRLRMGA